jgi:hypothetical protein
MCDHQGLGSVPLTALQLDHRPIHNSSFIYKIRRSDQIRFSSSLLLKKDQINSIPREKESGSGWWNRGRDAETVSNHYRCNTWIGISYHFTSDTYSVLYIHTYITVTPSSLLNAAMLRPVLLESILKNGAQAGDPLAAVLQ